MHAPLEHRLLLLAATSGVLAPRPSWAADADTTALWQDLGKVDRGKLRRS